MPIDLGFGLTVDRQVMHVGMDFGYEIQVAIHAVAIHATYICLANQFVFTVPVIPNCVYFKAINLTCQHPTSIHTLLCIRLQGTFTVLQFEKIQSLHSDLSNTTDVLILYSVCVPAQNISGI